MNPEPATRPLPAADTRMHLTVRGATLAAMAAAARLARLGHEVVLVTDGEPLGDRWAPAPGPAGHVVDAMAQVVTLPATWRDLFKKSGAHLRTELNRVGLALVEAPAAEHRFADGTVVALPTDRAGRSRAVEAAFGRKAARSWLALTEGLDDLWLAYRHHALEGVAAVRTREQRRALWLDRTLGDLADDLGSPLGRLLTDLGDSPRSPGLMAVPLHVEHLFGRWQLVDADGMPQRPSRLLELLSGRLRERGVAVVAGSATEAALDCRPTLPTRALLRRGTPPAPAPLVTQEFRDEPAADVREVVDHTAARPVVSWQRPATDGALVTTHDHRHPAPDPAWGAATHSARDWLGRVPVPGGTIRASAASPAGAEPWAELSSAALAVYELHQRLTGEDSRPTNKDFRPPRAPAPHDGRSARG
ncbi:hypothetical protein LKO27_08285 [Tessaracoccus sp. OS52]|uniref:hypothetical protein n=1 Tax=Tessaracoccus sp. OS52 TaxID=2886691 RepID=UPI001D10D115|nr:hypothetical protein [Tessaracoccus sp. OS52]MCC2593404.1 hypothetical protein [Tessaracoccus sp. OS52]